MTRAAGAPGTAGAAYRDRRSATPAEFDAMLARTDAAPAAPESWEQRVETAARAMWEDEHPDTKWWELMDWVKDLCRKRAAAALHADADTRGQ